MRYRTTWQLVAITAVCTSVGLLITYNVYATTRSVISPLLLVLFGCGGAALFMAVVWRGEEVERGGAALRLWRNLVVAVVLVGGGDRVLDV